MRAGSVTSLLAINSRRSGRGWKQAGAGGKTGLRRGGRRFCLQKRNFWAVQVVCARMLPAIPMTTPISKILGTALTTVVLLASAVAQDAPRKKKPHVDPDLSKLPPASKQAGLTYEKDIRPMLEQSCFRCHGKDKQKGELRLDTLEAVLKGGEDGKVVTPGESAKSALVVSAAQIDDETAMPPKKKGGPGNGPRPGAPDGPTPPAGPDGKPAKPRRWSAGETSDRRSGGDSPGLDRPGSEINRECF